MKIVKEDMEFDEIYKGKVKSIATGGYIPFFKRFIGRIVHIIIPKEKKAFWLFSKDDLKTLKISVEKMEFPHPYASQRKKEVISSINCILKNPESFNLEELENIVESLENEKTDNFSNELLKKIKKSYSI